MRLLLFIHSLGAGGAERVTATLASHWAARGWPVTVVTLAGTVEDRYQVHPAVTRIGLDQAGESRGPLGAALQNWRRIRVLREVLKRSRPDVALAMMNTANVLLAFAAVGLRGVRRIGSERTYPPQWPLARPWEWLRARAYRWLDAVVVPTSESRDWVLRHTSARRASVIPNPVVHPLPVQAPLRSPDGVGLKARRRLITAGRLGEEKQYDRLVETFARLAPAFPDWELVIVGEGPERAALQARIDTLGLGDAVLLPGHVGNIGEWYDRADLYVLCSRFEGFPNALVEAMASGLPAVSFDCDTGPRDIIRPEVDGLLIPPGDWSRLADALARLMSDSSTRHQFGARAVEARTRFAIDRVAGMWEQLFEDRSA